jgi:hypothetical protein
MDHLTEEQLVLYYYGEPVGAAVEQHLGACEACRDEYRALQRVLNSVDAMPVPERSPEYGSEVWERLGPHLGGARIESGWRRWLGWRPALAAAAMAAAVLIAFFAGRYGENPLRREVAVAQPQPPRERILLVAVGDHLERSQMVLAELANAGPHRGKLDISYEQHVAEDLVESNRLYRLTANSAGDLATANMLDDLERVLLDIVHSPSELSGPQLRDLRRQIEADGLLFKVKVFESNIQHREMSPAVTN